MTVKLSRLLARLAAALPLSWNRGLGWLVGQLAWLARLNARYDTLVNLQLCFPDMPSDERQTLARASLVDTGRMLLETPWVWMRPSHESIKLIGNRAALDQLSARLANGQGTIIASPHVGNWELCAVALADIAPFTYFYKSRKNSELDAFVAECRANMGGKGVPLTAGGIREGLKCLKRGELLGILPDQEPDAGVFAPFFNAPALTMTLISKLAQRSGAPVMFCTMERDLSAGGWNFHLFEADPAIASTNEAEAATALNRAVMQCAAINPPQYLWDYRRFATLPSGERRNYREARRRIRLAT